MLLSHETYSSDRIIAGETETVHYLLVYDRYQNRFADRESEILFISFVLHEMHATVRMVC